MKNDVCFKNTDQHSLTMVMQTVQVIVSLAASIPAKPVSISISILWCNARNILHHELLETIKQKQSHSAESFTEI